jgi:MFS family permease
MTPASKGTAPYAWLITAACFWMATLAWGTVFYGNTFFVPALQQEHGWSAATVSSAIALFFWLAIPVTLVFGWIADTFGTRLAVAYSGLAIGGGVAAMGQLTEPWQLYLAYALIATGYPLMATPAISASLVPWFGPKMGLPLSLALSGASLGGAVSVPLMVWASARYGFPASTLTVGLVVAGTIVPLALLILRRPSNAQKPPSAAAETSFTPRQALTTSRFWRIAIAGGLGLGAQVGYLSHQLAIGSDVASVDHAA